MIKKLIWILLIIFPISNSFGEATLKHVQTVAFDDGEQNQNNIIAGIEFNKDGTKLFTSSANKTDPGQIMEFNLSTPYDISSRSYAGDGERCTMTEVEKTPYDLEFNHDGTKLFVATRAAGAGADLDKLFRYDLTTPYDISSVSASTQVADDGINYSTLEIFHWWETITRVTVKLGFKVLNLTTKVQNYF